MYDARTTHASVPREAARSCYRRVLDGIETYKKPPTGRLVRRHVSLARAHKSAYNISQKVRNFLVSASHTSYYYIIETLLLLLLLLYVFVRRARRRTMAGALETV